MIGPALVAIRECVVRGASGNMAYAEQQMNAVHPVRELGMAVEIKMATEGILETRFRSKLYLRRRSKNSIRKLMMDGNDETELIRKKVKEASEKSWIALTQGGSSLGHLIQEIINNVPLRIKWLDRDFL